jgi:hypothetical protein
MVVATVGAGTEVPARMRSVVSASPSRGDSDTDVGLDDDGGGPGAVDDPSSGGAEAGCGTNAAMTERGSPRMGVDSTPPSRGNGDRGDSRRDRSRSGPNDVRAGGSTLDGEEDDDVSLVDEGDAEVAEDEEEEVDVFLVEVDEGSRKLAACAVAGRSTLIPIHRPSAITAKQPTRNSQRRQRAGTASEKPVSSAPIRG